MGSNDVKMDDDAIRQKSLKIRKQKLQDKQTVKLKYTVY